MGYDYSYFQLRRSPYYEGLDLGLYSIPIISNQAGLSFEIHFSNNMNFNFFQAIKHHVSISYIDDLKLQVRRPIIFLKYLSDSLRHWKNLSISMAWDSFYTGLYKERVLYIRHRENGNGSLEIGAFHFHQHHAWINTPCKYMIYSIFGVFVFNKFISLIVNLKLLLINPELSYHQVI